jgi:hypothetical protein
VDSCVDFVFDEEVCYCSPTLHEHQKEAVGAGSHGHKVKIKLVDLMDVAEKRVELVDVSSVPTYVMAFEVLDNLPHDKIKVQQETNNNTLSIFQAQIWQRQKQHDRKAIVSTTTTNNEFKNNKEDDYFLEETFVELRDHLLQSILATVPSVSKTPAQWIPTVACGVTDHLFQNRKNVHLILADFDWLLPSQDTSMVKGSPLITCMNDID